MKHASLSILHERLWKVFSQYIRLRDCLRTTEDPEWGKCITCDDVKPFQLLDAGHFISRRYMNTRYDEHNVHAQCKKCNGFYAGEQYKYSQVISEMYGSSEVDRLVQEKCKTRRFKPHELEELINVYKEKIKEISQ